MVNLGGGATPFSRLEEVQGTVVTPVQVKQRENPSATVDIAPSDGNTATVSPAI